MRHAGANEEQIAAAVEAGATALRTSVTPRISCFRGSRTLFSKRMADNHLSASFIVGGIHLDDSFLRVAVRAKGGERTVLVLTDAAAPAGAAAGVRFPGELEVDLTPDHSRRSRWDGQACGIGAAYGSRPDQPDAHRKQYVAATPLQTATADPARLIDWRGVPT